ncbi:MAG: GTPase HflX [Actinobacteria bacterium]|nr:MAG: GTPase HflX [Actinomycetota bacterium]
MEQVALAPERAFLVVVDEKRFASWTAEDETAELENLTRTAGVGVAGAVVQQRERPDPKTYIGKGKVQELKQSSAAAGATLIIFSEELTPSQQRNLEEIVGLRVLDRTGLILDIFAQHAHTKEGKLQVELAQYQYLLPRLRGFGLMWSRTGGGIGTRGPGEQQLEVDRRRIRRRIQALTKELARVARERETQRKLRLRTGTFNVCLVGYTNAGKSSLLNKLTGAGVLVEDKLFATLDSTSRRLDLDRSPPVVLTDTVGFIHDLPHGLVAAFRSTLDEVRVADVLLHVVDASHDQLRREMASVLEVLGELGVADKPRVDVFNKIDLLDETRLQLLRERYPGAAFVSASTGLGIGELESAIARAAAAEMVQLSLVVPYAEGGVVRKLHERGSVIAEEHDEHGTLLTVRMHRDEAGPFAKYAAKGRRHQSA